MKYRNQLITMSLVLMTAGCGGGSGSSSAVDGTWRGDLIQGVILCSDGTGIGAGGGSVIRKLALEISGEDALGSIVQVLDEKCLLKGPREPSGFRAVPQSGCDETLAALQFDFLPDGSAAVKYYQDQSLVPAGPNGVRCSISPEANVTR